MKIIECPRDAMQGINAFIPTDLKIQYVNQLLKVGFDTIDFGSFVSPKAIPQLRDTAEVLDRLELTDTSQLLAIVANVRGAETATNFDEIDYLGYPLSLSETFQKRNTNRSIDDAFDNLAEIQELCQIHDKTLVVYLSMGFGNPYGDPYEIDYVGSFMERLDEMEVNVASLADTIGVATPDQITHLFTALIPKFPHIEIGAHLHSTPDAAKEKVSAAFDSGCRRIDGALKGYGGCPMADDELVGNMATETIISSTEEAGIHLSLDHEALKASHQLATHIFEKFH